MAAAFKTIHIFGFGDVQMIGETSGTVKAADLSTVTALVNNIKSLKPADVVLKDHHVIHLFEGADARYLGKKGEAKEETSFAVKLDSLDQAALTAFVQELTTKIKA